MDVKYQIFVSSTYEDLKEERREIINLILELGHIPVSMEFFPASNDDQWTLIKRLLDTSDYFIVIVGGMYGSENRGSGKSYTQLEYEYAKDNGIPVVGFIQHDSVLLAGKCEKDPAKLKQLDDFKELVKEKMCRFWRNPHELKSEAAVSLDRLFKDYPSQGWIRAPKNNQPIKPNKNITEIQKLAADNYWKSEDEIRKLVDVAQASFYDFIEYYYLIEGLYSHSNTIDMPSGSLVPIRTNKVSADHPLIDQLWKLAYKTIHIFVRIKDALKEKQEFADVDDNATISLSYIYYTLCELWGRVPYVLRMITNMDDVMLAHTPINTIREDSISNLLKITKSDHRGDIVLPDFAKGMLVKWYLQAGKYVQAKVFAEQIINSGRYKLAALDKIFDTKDEMIAGYDAMARDKLDGTNFSKYIRKGRFVLYMRYTEILFMASEIYFNLSEYERAIECLNMIKERNHHVPFSGEKHLFVEALLLEWRDDLGMGGSYFAALKRNGFTSKILEIQAWQELLPIPQMELDLNPKMTQNTGY